MADKLQQKRGALTNARAGRAKIEADLPILKAAVETTRKELDQAGVEVLIAHGTAEVQDDAAAERILIDVQLRHDAAVQALDAAEERYAFLRRAEAQLHAELGALDGAARTAHFKASVAKLQARLAELAPLVAEAIKVGSAMSKIRSHDWWHDGLAHELKKDLGIDVRVLIREGQQLAAHVRAGNEVP